MNEHQIRGLLMRLDAIAHLLAEGQGKRVVFDNYSYEILLAEQKTEMRFSGSGPIDLKLDGEALRRILESGV